MCYAENGLMELKLLLKKVTKIVLPKFATDAILRKGPPTNWSSWCGKNFRNDSQKVSVAKTVEQFCMNWEPVLETSFPQVTKSIEAEVITI